MSSQAASLTCGEPQDVLLEVHARGHDAVALGLRLLRMYDAFARQQGWTTTPIWPAPVRASATIMDAVVQVRGNAYALLQHEHGTHHLHDADNPGRAGGEPWSTAQVIVGPGVPPEEVICPPEDVRLDLFRHGEDADLGIRSTDTVLRLTHVPTGVHVLCHGPLKNGHDMPCLFALKARLRAQQVGATTAMSVVRNVRTYDATADQIMDVRLSHPVAHAARVLAGELGPLIRAVPHGGC